MVTDSKGHIFIGEAFQVMEFDSLEEAEKYLLPECLRNQAI